MRLASFNLTVKTYRPSRVVRSDRLLQFLSQGHKLDPLLVGKLPLAYVPLVEELMWREVLRPPRLRPRWLELPQAAGLLATLQEGLTLLDLTERIAS